ncbi:MAG: bifunctional alpha,alpha-trehalose-phosphate synthase (UDP-forming)/trehalose-phosphatase [Bacteriovoracaceae bacterium]|nr:bifunctional alpha,alpha-trehalose-phosphate synthase (UDP-forming)/trehalose-phosphatase [Bacteriovoracaceae bacterium]
MSRWIIVSNRLPFSYDEENKKLKPSSGGLVTAIRGIKTKEEVLWVGSIPNNVPKKLVRQYKDQDNISFSFPDLDKELYDNYYNGFCNDVLWPILHYESESVKFSNERWEDYIRVNQIFANHVAKVAKKDDIIWLHDYQLFLAPKMIKEINPNLKVGFFLHVPFPSSEIWRHLPVREEILEAMIHADLIGFHDFAYLRHFVSSVYNLLGIHSSLLEIRSPHNNTKLGVYPVSINTQDFISKASSKKTAKAIHRYGLDIGDRKYILGVDRLDYSKGILYKLEAYQSFLRENPKYVGRVQLIQIAVPSRTDVPEYIKLRHDVERLVSEINGEFSEIDYIPVKYIFNSVSVHDLMALYRASDILLVTSKRDGMNLVCLEYIATQDPKDPGVVMLSEFAGAASTLSHATIINPMNIADTAQKIKESLEVKLEERKKRHNIMFDYLKEYTATTWAGAFINHLKKKTLESNPKLQDLSQQAKFEKLKKGFDKKRRVLLLDYDGTLTPIVNDPSAAVLKPRMKSLIKKLQKRDDTDVVIITGRDSNFISKQFEGIECYLACEHGAKFYDYKNKKWRNLVASSKKEWFSQATQIIKEYTRRTPSSFFEKKNYAIAWHYRNSPQDFGEFQARKLVIDLESGLSHLPVSVIMGKKVVEVKSIEANKGYFTQWFASRYVEKDQKLFSIGDDRTDEDMFRALEANGETVKVGTPEKTSAKNYIEDQGDVYKLLKELFLD